MALDAPRYPCDSAPAQRRTACKHIRGSMTHRSPRRSCFLPSAAIAILGFLGVYPDARAAALTTIAQAQTGHGAASGAATFKLGDLTVTSPWTRATPGGAKIAGGYLKITNDGTTPDRFVGVKSD